MKINSIKTKLILFILAIVVLSNLYIGIVTYNVSNKALTKSVYGSFNSITQDVVHQMENMNKTEFNFLHNLASMSYVQNTSIDVKDKFVMFREIASQNAERYQDICMADENGRGFTQAGTYRDFSTSNWVKGVTENGNSDYIRDPKYSSSDDMLLMFYAVPVFASDGRTRAGTLSSVFHGEEMDRILAEIDIGDGCHPLIINRKSRMIIADGKELSKTGGTVIDDLDKESEYYGILDAVCRGETGSGEYMDAESGKKMVCSYAPVEDCSSWAVLSTAPYDFYFDDLLRLQKIMNSLIFGNVIFIIIVGILFISHLLRPLISLKSSISEIASGNADLTKRIEVKSRDEIGDVVAGFNNFTAKLQEIISQVKNCKNELNEAGSDLGASTEDTVNSISEINANIEGIHGYIGEQGKSVEETSQSVNEIAGNIEALERMIETQSSGVTQASAAVEEMIGNISSVNTSVDKMASSFEKLNEQARLGSSKQADVNERIRNIEEQSDMLQEANLAIASIAEQTNLLAMNAAIEAAHAGEAGKGFSVVADEIRKLSETSGQQSKTIGEQLTNIKESINSVVNASEESSQAFNTVSVMIVETDQLVRQIKAAMEEQREGSKQIVSSLHSMNDSTTEVRQASAEMADNNKSILDQITLLQEKTEGINSNMKIVSAGALKISETGRALEGISAKMGDSIKKLDDQVDKFQV